MRRLLKIRYVLLTVLGILVMTIPAVAKDTAVKQTWEVINPSGIVDVKYFKPAPRLNTLEGKTVVLRWNEKHNGDNFLNRIAELFKERFPTTKVIKLYEVDKSTVEISGSIKEAIRIAKVIKDLKADIVIGAQCD